jgi:hypothetical protein
MISPVRWPSQQIPRQKALTSISKNRKRNVLEASERCSVSLGGGTLKEIKTNFTPARVFCYANTSP